MIGLIVCRLIQIRLRVSLVLRCTLIEGNFVCVMDILHYEQFLIYDMDLLTSSYVLCLQQSIPLCHSF